MIWAGKSIKTVFFVATTDKRCFLNPDTVVSSFVCSSLSKYSHSHCRPLVTEMLPFWDFFLNAFLYGQSSNNTTKNNPKLWSCSVWVLYKSPIGQLKSVKQVVTGHEIRLFIVLFKGQSHKIRCKLQYCTASE